MKLPELKEDCVYSDLEFQIDRIKRKKSKYVYAYRGINILVFILSAATTVLAGWKSVGDIKTGIDDAVLITSATVSVMIAVEALFGLKDKALNYDLLLFELRSLRDEMCFAFSKNREAYTANRDTYFKRLIEIQESQKAIIAAAYD